MKKNEPWIGTDESGKGDYFGPLVIAAVCLDSGGARKLESLGVKDSKKLTDARILLLAPKIREVALESDVVAIGPEKYNELYSKMKNLNTLLAWGHARVIENILSRKMVGHVLTDQFGDRSLVESALQSKGKTVLLEQRPRAEEDTAVAAASCLARAEFISRLEKLSKQEGLPLPKGASDLVIQAGKKLVREKGEAALKRVAKLHFKTTRVVLGENMTKK